MKVEFEKEWWTDKKVDHRRDRRYGTQLTLMVQVLSEIPFSSTEIFSGVEVERGLDDHPTILALREVCEVNTVQPGEVYGRPDNGKYTRLLQVECFFPSPRPSEAKTAEECFKLFNRYDVQEAVVRVIRGIERQREQSRKLADEANHWLTYLVKDIVEEAKERCRYEERLEALKQEFEKAKADVARGMSGQICDTAEDDEEIDARVTRLVLDNLDKAIVDRGLTRRGHPDDCRVSLVTPEDF